MYRTPPMTGQNTTTFFPFMQRMRTLANLALRRFGMCVLSAVLLPLVSDPDVNKVIAQHIKFVSSSSQPLSSPSCPTLHSPSTGPPHLTLTLYLRQMPFTPSLPLTQHMTATHNATFINSGMEQPTSKYEMTFSHVHAAEMIVHSVLNVFSLVQLTEQIPFPCKL